MKTFKQGDFVRVLENVHDAAIPVSRMGHLVEPVFTHIHYTSTEPEATNVWVLLMTNGKKLRFHTMHLEHVNANGGGY